jgi:hypothetical protein
MVTQNEQVLITMPIRDMVVSVVMLLSKLKKNVIMLGNGEKLYFIIKERNAQ